MLALTRTTISGGFLHLNPKIKRRFINIDNPRHAICVAAGDHLLIEVENEPINLTLKVPFHTWEIGRLHERKICQFDIHIERWKDLLKIEKEDGHRYVTLEIGVASVDEEGYGLIDADQPEIISDIDAYDVVDKFLDKHVNSDNTTVTTFTAGKVVRDAGIPAKSGNIQRVRKAIQTQFDPIDGNSTPRRFKIPEEYE